MEDARRRGEARQSGMGREDRIRQEMAGVDRLLCFQVDILRVLVLAKGEHGSRGQDQGCHIQQLIDTGA